MKEDIDVQQLIEFFKENENRIYKFAYGYVKDQEMALDLVHESIVKAIQKRDTLKEKQYLKTWFYRILINECITTLRKNKKITFIDEIKENECIEQINDFVTKNEYIDLYDAIDGLPPKLKTIIMLRYFEDMKLDEIAEITKTNLSTIKSRLYKALEILKIQMKGECL